MEKVQVILCIIFCARAIVNGAGLNGHCESKDHCGTVDSYCNNGTCVCIQGFAYYDGTCIQAADPRMGCREDTDCKPMLGGRSICKDASCACLPNHHLYNNNCIKNRGLNERCDEDYQCYWGKDMLEKMSCVNGECVCKEGYRPHQHRKCEVSSASALTTSVTLITFLVIVYKMF